MAAAVPVNLSVADIPKRMALSGNVDAAGLCTIRFGVQGQVAWSVEQITVDMPTAPVGAVCALRVNGVLVTPLIASGDAAAGDPPLPVFPGDVVTVEWTGATPQDQGRALVIYRAATYG